MPGPGCGFGIERTKEMEYKKRAGEAGFKKISLTVMGNQEKPTKYLYSHLIQLESSHLII